MEPDFTNKMLSLLKTIQHKENTDCTRNPKLFENILHETLTIFDKKLKETSENNSENEKLEHSHLLIKIICFSLNHSFESENPNSFYSHFDDFYLRNEIDLFFGRKLHSINESEDVDFPESNLIEEFSKVHKEFISAHAFQPAFIFNLIQKNDKHVIFICEILDLINNFKFKSQYTKIDPNPKKSVSKTQNESKKNPDLKNFQSKFEERNENQKNLIEENEVLSQKIKEAILTGKLSEIQKVLVEFNFSDISDELNKISFYADRKLSELPLNFEIPKFLQNIKFEKIQKSKSEIFNGNSDWIYFMHKINQNLNEKNKPWKNIADFFKFKNLNENTENGQSKIFDILLLHFQNYLNLIIMRKFILLRKICKKSYFAFNEKIEIENVFQKNTSEIWEYIFGEPEEDDSFCQVNFRSFLLNLTKKISRFAPIFVFFPLILSQKNDLKDDSIECDFFSEYYSNKNLKINEFLIAEVLNKLAQRNLKFNWQKGDIFSQKLAELFLEENYSETKIDFLIDNISDKLIQKEIKSKVINQADLVNTKNASLDLLSLNSQNKILAINEHELSDQKIPIKLDFETSKIDNFSIFIFNLSKKLKNSKLNSKDKCFLMNQIEINLKQEFTLIEKSQITQILQYLNSSLTTLQQMENLMASCDPKSNLQKKFIIQKCDLYQSEVY